MRESTGKNRKMKAIVWDGTDYPDSLSYRDFDVPAPDPGWVLFTSFNSMPCRSIGLVTHRFPPEEYRRALDVAIHKSEYQAIKPMFIRE
jgi:hypothetical protein